MDISRKIALLILIVILFDMFSHKAAPNSVDLSAAQMDAYGVAGLIHMVSPKGESKPDDAPVITEVCKCDKSTGLISYDGGTSKVKCTCSNGGKPCGCVNSPKSEDDGMLSIADVSVLESGRKPRMILFTDKKFCAPCRIVDSTIVNVLKQDSYVKAGWSVGESNENCLQIVDLNASQENKDLYAEVTKELKEKYKDSQANGRIPTFVKIYPSNQNISPKIVHVGGDLTMSQFIELFNKATE